MVNELEYLLSKGIKTILKDAIKLEKNVNAVLGAINADRIAIAKAAGISVSQLDRRKNNPELWKKSELLKIAEHFDIK